MRAYQITMAGELIALVRNARNVYMNLREANANIKVVKSDLMDELRDKIRLDRDEFTAQMYCHIDPEGDLWIG